MEDYPDVIQVEPTTCCNFTCPRCPMRVMKYPRGVMEEKVFKAIIDEIAGKHVAVKLFFLGEPMLHPDVDAMLIYAYSKGVPIAVATNGSLLTERQIGMLLKYSASLAISVDGTDASSYEKLRRGGNYAQLRRTVERICELNRQQRNIPFMLVTILPDTDYNQYITQFAKEWEQIEGVKFTMLQTQHYEKRDRPPIDYVCEDGLKSLIIRWDGKVTYCCGDIDTLTVLGTIPEMKVTDIWKSALLHMVHDSIIYKKGMYACKSCKIRYHRFLKDPLELTEETYALLSDGMQKALQLQLKQKERK